MTFARPYRRLCFVFAYFICLRYDRVTRVIERGLEAMRDLNGRSSVAVGNDASSGPSGWKVSKGEEESRSSAAVSLVDPSSSQKVIKRSRLPAAAVKEMRCAACGADHVATGWWVLSDPNARKLYMAADLLSRCRAFFSSWKARCRGTTCGVKTVELRVTMTVSYVCLLFSLWWVEFSWFGGGVGGVGCCCCCRRCCCWSFLSRERRGTQKSDGKVAYYTVFAENGTGGPTRGAGFDKRNVLPYALKKNRSAPNDRNQENCACCFLLLRYQ